MRERRERATHAKEAPEALDAGFFSSPTRFGIDARKFLARINPARLDSLSAAADLTLVLPLALFFLRAFLSSSSSSRSTVIEYWIRDAIDPDPHLPAPFLLDPVARLRLIRRRDRIERAVVDRVDDFEGRHAEADLFERRDGEGMRRRGGRWRWRWWWW